MELMRFGVWYRTCPFADGFGTNLVNGKPMFDEASVGHDWAHLSLHKVQGRFREPALARVEIVSPSLRVHQLERIQYPARAVPVLQAGMPPTRFAVVHVPNRIGEPSCLVP